MTANAGTSSRNSRYHATSISGDRIMKASATIFAVAALAIVAASPADAKGCLKGAVVGGVAGHYAGHHGVLGAIAGCAYGRHEANQRDRQQDQQRQTRAPAGQEKL
jgi:outer membrane lipoprotein SlyB